MLTHQCLAADNTDKLVSNHYQILISYHAIKTILQDHFTVCEARSVLEVEPASIKLIYHDRELEIFGVRSLLAGRADRGNKR